MLDSRSCLPSGLDSPTRYLHHADSSEYGVEEPFGPGGVGMVLGGQAYAGYQVYEVVGGGVASDCAAVLRARDQVGGCFHDGCPALRALIGAAGECRRSEPFIATGVQ
jgi:hypothetical protein